MCFSRRGVRVAAAVALAAAGVAGAAAAAVYRTVDDALAEAFPGAEIRRDVLYPSEAQRGEAEALAGTPVPLPVYRYRAYRDGRYVGAAYPDRHRVRTLPETVLVVVDPAGTVRDVRVLAFAEPEEYLPGERWFAQFDGRALGPGLALHRGIDGVSGATLTGRAVTQCVRRALAVHRVLGTGDTAP